MQFTHYNDFGLLHKTEEGYGEIRKIISIYSDRIKYNEIGYF